MPLISDKEGKIIIARKEALENLCMDNKENVIVGFELIAGRIPAYRLSGEGEPCESCNYFLKYKGKPYCLESPCLEV